MDEVREDASAATPGAPAEAAPAVDAAPVEVGAPAEVAPAVDAAPVEVGPPLDDGGTDSTFSADLSPDVRDFGQDRPLATVCPWCGAPLADPSVDACPTCGTRLKPIQDDLEVPGLTTVSPEARAAQARVEIARLRAAARRGEVVPAGGGPPVSPEPVLPPAPPPVLGESEIEAAIQPPDTDVRRIMLEMEIAARRAAIEREMQPLEMGDEPEPTAASGAVQTTTAAAETVEPESSPAD